MVLAKPCVSCLAVEFKFIALRKDFEIRHFWRK